MKTGLELELLAPRGSSRVALARALAEAFSGTLLYKLKYASPGLDPQQRPVCILSLAVEVVCDGRSLLTCVDDLTIRDDLDADAAPQLPALVTDDVRLATWLELNTSANAPTFDALTALLRETFNATRDERDQWVDPWGTVLARGIAQRGERERVCEVVTRPLTSEERRETLTTILQTAAALGFTVPAEAACHAHYDAEPWLDADMLRHLILDYTDERGELHTVLQPNPRCRKLGPFPDHALRVAREAPPDIALNTLRAALEMALPGKGYDLNLLGLVQRYARQRTLEVRCLPMSLDATEILRRLEHIEGFLRSVNPRF